MSKKKEKEKLMKIYEYKFDVSFSFFFLHSVNKIKDLTEEEDEEIKTET